MSKVSVQVETISPDQAAEYLGRSKNFRKLDEARAKEIARAIADGNFDITNDAMTIDDDGNVTNGQHRLRACVIANKPITLLVLRGVNDDRFFDVGRKRTAAQLLASLGYSYGADTLSAAVRLVWFHYGPGIAYAFGGRITANNADIIRTIERHPGIVDSVKTCYQAKRLAPVSMLAYIHYFASRGAKDAADQFVAAIATGEGITRADSAYWLRERLISDRGRRGTLSRRFDFLKLSVKAWNMWAAGTPCRALKIHATEELQPIAHSEPVEMVERDASARVGA